MAPRTEDDRIFDQKSRAEILIELPPPRVYADVNSDDSLANERVSRNNIKKERNT